MSTEQERAPEILWARDRWERGRPAGERLGVSQETLYRWRKAGVIESRMKGGIRYYNVGKFLEELDDHANDNAGE